MTPAEFQEYWKNSHGPLIASSQCGSHVIRYEQNPRPLGRLSRGRRPVRVRRGHRPVVRLHGRLLRGHAAMSTRRPCSRTSRSSSTPTILSSSSTEEPRVIMDGEVDWSILNPERGEPRQGASPATRPGTWAPRWYRDPVRIVSLLPRPPRSSSPSVPAMQVRGVTNGCDYPDEARLCDRRRPPPSCETASRPHRSMPR